MSSKWVQIFELFLGVGAEIAPVFIHNPQSGKIEAVIVSTLEGVLSGLAGVTPPAHPPAA